MKSCKDYDKTEGCCAYQCMYCWFNYQLSDADKETILKECMKMQEQVETAD
jgi:hypothetical protein